MAATPWIESEFAAEPADLRVFVLHHHLLPVPGTGRERNVVYDAGDVIECLLRAGVQLVLSGHKHVPYAWRLENLFVVNTGTVSSLRLRGNSRPCYNVIEITGSHVDIWRRHPFHGQERIIQFSTDTFEYEKYTGRIESEVTVALVRAVAVIDGEHYASVVRDALVELPQEIVACVLVGGTEKLRGGEDYGVPLASLARGGDRRARARRRARPLGRARARAAGAVPARRAGAGARRAVRRGRLPARAAALRADRRRRPSR